MKNILLAILLISGVSGCASSKDDWQAPLKASMMLYPVLHPIKAFSGLHDDPDFHETDMTSPKDKS